MALNRILATISVGAIFISVACARQVCLGYATDLNECKDTCFAFGYGLEGNCSSAPTQAPAVANTFAVVPRTASIPFGMEAPQPKASASSLEAAAATPKAASQGAPVPPSAPTSNSCYCCCSGEQQE